MTNQFQNRASLYWIGEICSYFGEAGRRGAVSLLSNRVVLAKLGRSLRHRCSAFFGHLVPLQPSLDALATRPPFLHLEFANICNARCVFCPYQHQTRPGQLMPEAVFLKAVADYVAAGGGSINLTPIVGDALVHPQFVPRVRYLRSFVGIHGIHMTTNGILLDQHGIDQILDCGLTSVIVSTAGFDSAMYERLYRSNSYDRMRRNVIALLRANRARGRPLEIRIALRPDRPLPEVMRQPDFQEILALKPVLTFHWAFGTAGDKLRPRDMPPRIQVLHKNAQLECCEYLYRGPVVLSDGTVLACSCSPAPMDFSAEMGLGNILDTSLLDMWRGPRMQEIRSRFAAQRLCPPCLGCNQYEGLDLYRTANGRRMARQCVEQNGVTRASTSASRKVAIASPPHR